MKKSMPAYITELSGDNFEVLEEIFIDKYQKFIQLYWLLSNYSDNIKKLYYNDSDKNELNISLEIINVKPDTVIKELNKEIDDSNVNIYKEKKKIYISIIEKDET